MTALLILAAYVAVGLVAGSVGLFRRKGELSERLGQAALGLVLWPFLLPVFLLSRKSPRPPPGGALLEGGSGLRSAGRMWPRAIGSSACQLGVLPLRRHPTIILKLRLTL